MADAFPVVRVAGSTIESVPWPLVETVRHRVERAHCQTLESLAARGGLDPLELVAALDGHVVIDRSRLAQSIDRLRKLVLAWEENNG